MMNSYSQPPTGSKIQVLREMDKTKISWTTKRSLVSVIPALFILFWLSGWLTGLLHVSQQIQRGANDLFLFAWLAGWCFGGLVAIRFLWQIVRPSIPETLLLDYTSVKYDSGVFPLDVTSLNSRFPSADENPLTRKRRRLTISRSEKPTFVLERVGERQRLRLDLGAERVVIGACLSEPEREWLYGILKEWQSQ